MRHKDPHGYYRILNVDPGAGHAEIRLAYQLVEQAWRDRRGGIDIDAAREAFAVLGDVARRARYDLPSGGARPAARFRLGGMPRVGLPGVLLALIGILAVVVVVVFGASISASLTSFEPGDRLYWTKDGRFLGTVQSYEANHEFHNGARAPAYLVEPSPDAASIWYPARDLQRTAEVR